jgi:hypothetical protein
MTERQMLSDPPFGHGVDKIAKNGSVLHTQAKNKNHERFSKIRGKPGAGRGNRSMNV